MIATVVRVERRPIDMRPSDDVPPISMDLRDMNRQPKNRTSNNEASKQAVIRGDVVINLSWSQSYGDWPP